MSVHRPSPFRLRVTATGSVSNPTSASHRCLTSASTAAGLRPTVLGAEKRLAWAAPSTWIMSTCSPIHGKGSPYTSLDFAETMTNSVDETTLYPSSGHALIILSFRCGWANTNCIPPVPTTYCKSEGHWMWKFCRPASMYPRGQHTMTLSPSFFVFSMHRP